MDGAKSTSKKKNIKPTKKRSRTDANISDDSLDENESNTSRRSTIDQFPEEDVIHDTNTLDNYIFRPLTSTQQHKLEQLLLKVTVSCGFAFQWIENDAVKCLFHWLNPMITLPTRQVLSGRILKEATDNESKELLENAKNDQFGVTLAFDGWKNVA